MEVATKQLFPSQTHDHEPCIAQALDQAAEICRARGIRFTSIRRQVLEIVWNRHAPIGAYDILDALRLAKRGATPPTVYRALEFLRAHGFVHKIECLNSFIGCGQPSITHMAQFLICSRCNQVGELDDPEIEVIIKKKASAAGFSVVRPTVEVMGICANCAADSHAG